MQWIRDIVEGVEEYYGTTDVCELLGLLEIDVINKHFKDPTRKAWLHQNILGDYYIFMSYDLSEPERIYILAHELAHVLLHDISIEYYCSSCVNKGKLEVQADYFASLLLLDPKHIDKHEIRNFNLDQLCAYFHMPKELIQFRLDECRGVMGCPDQ